MIHLILILLFLGGVALDFWYVYTYGPYFESEESNRQDDLDLIE